MTHIVGGVMMGESSNSEKTVREYLLGRVSDEAALEGIEELLFTDEEFCTRVALTEDDLINDYVLGRLDEADAASFRATLAGNPERSFKVELTRKLKAKAAAGRVTAAEGAGGLRAAEAGGSFLASLKGFFSQPKYAGAFAVLLIAAAAAATYFVSSNNPDELDELRAAYRRERPTETRLSEFGYAPLPQLRGEAEPRERNGLRRIGMRLIEDAEKTPNARTLHALGVYYLTERNYTEAIREFEGALKFAGNDARIHNDLGAAYFELAKASSKEKRLESLARALEEFTAATELDADSPEALFNKALTLQELNLPRLAKESWALYLRKDPSSPWAEEARRNLARIESEQARFKPDEQVLRDFLDAYRNRDGERARRIHNETKGLLKAVSVPLQLTRRFLLAKLRGDEDEARESVAALAYIGDYERAQNSEFFFLNWPASTRTSARTRRNGCCGPGTYSTAGNNSSSTAVAVSSGAIT